MALSSFPPSPASHPCLRKEPGSVCVARSRKQSCPPGHGSEGQEHGEAEGLEGGDPAVQGVVTCSQQCQTQTCGRSVSGAFETRLSSTRTARSLSLALAAGNNSQVLRDCCVLPRPLETVLGCSRCIH